MAQSVEDALDVLMLGQVPPVEHLYDPYSIKNRCRDTTEQFSGPLKSIRGAER